jgi:hypothetical protein
MTPRTHQYLVTSDVFSEILSHIAAIKMRAGERGNRLESQGRRCLSSFSFSLLFLSLCFRPTEASAKQRQLKKDDEEAVADGKNVGFNVCDLKGRKRGDEQA